MAIINNLPCGDSLSNHIRTFFCCGYNANGKLQVVSISAKSDPTSDTFPLNYSTSAAQTFYFYLRKPVKLSFDVYTGLYDYTHTPTVVTLEAGFMYKISQPKMYSVSNFLRTDGKLKIEADYTTIYEQNYVGPITIEKV